MPSSYLLLTYQNGTSLANKPSSQLFIPKAELADLLWSVPPPSLEEASATHDVTRVDHPVALPAAIQELIKAFPGAIVHTLPTSPLFPTIPSQYTAAFLSGNVHVTEDYLLAALHRARLTKDAVEIEVNDRVWDKVDFIDQGVTVVTPEEEDGTAEDSGTDASTDGTESSDGTDGTDASGTDAEADSTADSAE